jgi:pyrimidine-nucleoside phosphorylase
MYDILYRKRNKVELATEEIAFFVREYTLGNIPDYQASAFLMAIFFNGLSPRETYDLTMAMARSGDQVSLQEIPGIKVDKHSTGGVGDKTSLILLPMVAACGVKIAKMSGRGLGHTGGTIDKLESFSGMRTALTQAEFVHQVRDIGMAIIGQSADLAPADKLLYALRDVTATVEELSLIASSIMSKKLASGCDAMVLDVKTGSGAFMKKRENAKKLANAMVDIGKRAGKNTIAVISDMDQPLGYAVGNALEVQEAIDTLRCAGPADLVQLCETLGTQMLLAGGITQDEDVARDLLRKAIQSGAALHKLEEFICAQGGDFSASLPRASIQEPVLVTQTGVVESINCEAIGRISIHLGGGRMTKADVIDLSVGVVLQKKVGDTCKVGDTLMILHGNDPMRVEVAKELALSSYRIAEQSVEKRPIILDIIR